MAKEKVKEEAKGRMVAECESAGVQEEVERKTNAFREISMIRPEQNDDDYKKKRGQTRKIVNEAVMGRLSKR